MFISILILVCHCKVIYEYTILLYFSVYPQKMIKDEYPIMNETIGTDMTYYLAGVFVLLMTTHCDESKQIKAHPALFAQIPW